MPGWRVERKPRTASRLPVSTPGGSPLMPPHSQGAERRPERRAGRAGSRWVLRALVVGGLAGAAWLLTGAAAYAAGSGPEPVTGSWFGTVTEDVERASGNEPVVGELLKAAVQPLESVPEIHHRVAMNPLPGSERETFERVGIAIDADPLDRVPREATAPLRTSGGDADDQAQPAAEQDTADSVAEPAGQRPAGEPEAQAPVTDTVVIPRPAAVLPEHPALTGTAATAVLAKASGSTRATRARTGGMPVRRVRAHSRSQMQRHVPAARPVAPEAIREDVPGGDGPAPAPTNLGAFSGIPAGASGGSAENGSSAVLPSGIANGPVACHRCPVAPDVDARRNDAEAPTVSPD